jgi:hypothetical protein
VSVATTYKAKLAEVGIIFCSISEAVHDHPELVRKYMGSVVPTSDNFYAALNSAVFTDGSFVFIPKGVKCPMDLSTYFRINTQDSGQFERTLIVAEEGASVSYLEGCTAPKFDTNQLHAAVVELVALDDADIKYSTVQNWYAGDENGVGGIYNFVTKRGLCQGRNSKISWTQVETGSAITWKYPSCVLLGDGSFGMNGLELDTAIRHRIPLLVVISLNGGWTADPKREKPGRDLGYTRFDQIATVLGGHGEYVERPEDIRPALERAQKAVEEGRVAVVNVVTDHMARATTVRFSKTST